MQHEQIKMLSRFIYFHISLDRCSLIVQGNFLPPYFELGGIILFILMPFSPKYVVANDNFNLRKRVS